MGIRTLVFAGGEIHDFKTVGPKIRAVLEADGGFDLTYVEDDLDVLAAPGLDGYELLVFYYTIGEISDAQKNGLLNWINAGGGFAGVHSAADSFRGCPEYRAMVGGHFITHPKMRDYPVSLADTEHQITRGLDGEFTVHDEQYVTDYDPRVHVLASSLWEGGTMPVAWTKSWGQGRVFYLALGHDGEAAEHDMFKQLLARGARWAGTVSQAQ